MFAKVATSNIPFSRNALAGETKKKSAFTFQIVNNWDTLSLVMHFMSP